MRIIRRPEFLRLPANTVFSEYEHCYFGPLMIKGDTLNDNDWSEQQIADAIKAHDSGEWTDLLFAAADQGKHLTFDFYYEGRDGSFDPDSKMYAVWDRSDVEQLITRLGECLSASATAQPLKESTP